MPFRKVATLQELPPGTLMELDLGGEQIAVCNVRGEVRAISGVCPHSFGPLGQGALEGDFITCPWHSWPFDTKTGACRFNPDVRVPVYPVQIEDSDVLVNLP